MQKKDKMPEEAKSKQPPDDKGGGTPAVSSRKKIITCDADIDDDTEWSDLCIDQDEPAQSDDRENG